MNALGSTNAGTMCLFDIPSATGKKGISVDICGNNTIYSTTYTSIGGGIIGSYVLNNLFTSAYYRHVALTISGSTHTLYLDNSAIVQNTNAPNIFNYYPSTFSNIYIGSAADLSYGYTGYIDDFKIWNSALVASDISSIYNNGNSSLPATILSGSKYLNNKKIYVFTVGSYTILPKTTTTATYLVVGGGGAGGASHAGGGGAGGVLSGTITLTAGVTYTITIGLGGVTTYVSNGSTNGGNSSIYGSGITTITAYGGGYGGGSVNGSPYSAGVNSSIIGSGGGGAGYTTTSSERYGGQTNSGQGNNGGYANGPIFGSIGGGGGGGGSGTVGLPSSTSIASGGAGGNGTALFSSILNNITSMMNAFISGWSTATNGYIAAGGGGGSWGEATHDPSDTVIASGGLGGGGKGGNTLLLVDATNGFANTGSGGGGGRGGYGVGGNGGSGLVVIIFN
jgi:hypothetical protein